MPGTTIRTHQRSVRRERLPSRRVLQRRVLQRHALRRQRRSRRPSNDRGQSRNPFRPAVLSRHLSVCTGTVSSDSSALIVSNALIGWNAQIARAVTDRFAMSGLIVVRGPIVVRVQSVLNAWIG